MTEHATEQQSIQNAITAWARSVFSAPRQLHELVTAVESRDEVLERVATQVVRRQVREVRAPTTERRSTRPRVDLSRFDPFAHTFATLKADSEHIAQCSACTASGMLRCEACHGAGRGPCPRCQGSGKERSAKTGHLINCQGCRATGSAPCRVCVGQGNVQCPGCRGSGHQLAWLTFDQTQRWVISVPASSPTVVAHPALQEGRPLTPGDLAAMTVLVERSHNGPLDLGQFTEAERQTIRTQLDHIDPRIERVESQQYLKIAALRRDVRFEMCGTKATLSLTGAQLIGATTPDVLLPIRRRLYAWIALCGLILVVGSLLRAAALGSPAHSGSTATSASAFLVLLAFGCAIPALGALLRSWRGGTRFHPIRRSTKVWSAGVAGALLAVAVVGLAAPSEPVRAQRASAAPAGPTQSTNNVQAGKPVAADERAQQLGQVRQLIAAQHPADALALLDQVFAGDRGADIADLRAQAHDALRAACPTAACQLGEAIQSRDAQSTPERVAAVDAAHQSAVAALDLAQVNAKQVLLRLQQLRQLHDAGAATTEVARDDADLQARAHKAIDAADAGRAAVPLLGNDLAVAEELLGSSTGSATGAPAIALGGVTVFLALDRTGHCTGVYAVGDRQNEREIKSEAWPPNRLVSQAVGRPSTVQPPSESQTTTRSYAGGTPVVARWLAGALIELRIGDATP